MSIINVSKTVNPMNKVGNNQPAKLSTTVAFRNILDLFWSFAYVNLAL